MSFNTAQMVGPVVAGAIIAAVGSGWAFLINAASFAAVLCSLSLLRVKDLHPIARAGRAHGSLVEGLRYAHSRPELKAILLMLFLIGTFGLNFPIFISTMSVKVFRGDAGQYGLLTSVMAVGAFAGALFAAWSEKPRFGFLLASAAVFGLSFTLAALTPNAWLFSVILVVIGASTMIFFNSTSSLMQLSTEPVMRGRVMALRLAIGVGATPIGAPVVGWVADTLGPRWALCVGAVAGFAAAGVAIYYLMKYPSHSGAS
jgi:MFS family permease